MNTIEIPHIGEVELYVDITVSENTLNLQCSLTGTELAIIEPYRGDEMKKANSNVNPVNLREKNPQLLAAIVKTVTTATDSQITVVKSDKNKDLQKVLNGYNAIHANEPAITKKDIVRYIDINNYAASYPGITGKFTGLLLHEFKNIYIEGLTEYMDGIKLYVKFVTPGKTNLVVAASTHADYAEKDIASELAFRSVVTKAKDTVRILDELNKK